MEDIIKVYRQTGSLRETAKILGTNWQTVRKVLITHGEYENEESKRINELLDDGMTVTEIAEKMNLSKTSVNSYLPYTKGKYLGVEPTKNALRIRKHRESSQ